MGDVIQVIAEHAFSASPYPLIIALEVQCCLAQQQARAALTLTPNPSPKQNPDTNPNPNPNPNPSFSPNPNPNPSPNPSRPSQRCFSRASATRSTYRTRRRAP